MHDRNPFPLWARLTIGVGAYALATKLLKFFASLGQRVKPPTASQYPEPGSPAFVHALGTALDAPVRCGGTADLLDNGDGFFPALLNAIRAAEHSVHLMTYIWRSGPLSDAIFDALTERAEAGVEVRLMYDALGGLSGAPRAGVRRLRQAGGQVTIFAPILSPHLIHVDRRNHRRAFVIDGRVAFTGGMSVDEQWTGDAEGPENWRDTMVRVTGPIAHSVQQAFLQLWTNITGELLVGEKYMPSDHAEDETDGAPDGTPKPVMLHLGVAHSPSMELQPLLHLFAFSLQAARKRILITNSYFMPDRYLRGILMKKAREGLDVRLLLPGRHTDNPLVRWAAQAFYEAFLEAGIRIYEYQPTMMHAKHLVVDGRWTLIGSANIDVRSIKLNQENVLGIADERLGAAVEATFERDLARSEEITLDAWRRRSRWMRLRDRVVTAGRAQY